MDLSSYTFRFHWCLKEGLILLSLGDEDKTSFWHTRHFLWHVKNCMEENVSVGKSVSYLACTKHNVIDNFLLK